MYRLVFLFLVTFTLWAKEPKAPELPAREVAVIVTKEGYYPNRLTVFKGERVKFFVTSTYEEADCFLLQGHQVFLAATRGKVTEAETTFEASGEVSFSCPSHGNKGKILVLDKNQKNPARNIASDAPDVWTPKEY